MYGYHAGSLWPLQDVVDADPKQTERPYKLPVKMRVTKSGPASICVRQAGMR